MKIKQLYAHPVNSDSDNHLGCSTFLADIAGEPYQFVMYLPFGETFAEQRAAGFGTPYLFNAKELDEETGLYYYGARYYDPRVSMWWGVDPLAVKFPSESSYLYTMNNPIRYIDPTGMNKEGWWLPKGGTELEYANNVNSQEDIDNSGGQITGDYIGETAFRVTDDGKTKSYNADGSQTEGIELKEVTVTPKSRNNLGSIVRNGSINLLGLQNWMDHGINNPQEALQATGTAVYHALILESTFIGIGSSVKYGLQASNMFLKSAYAADIGISIAGIFDSMLGINSDLIKMLNGVSGVFGIRNSIRENKAPALHDAHGLLNTIHKDNPEKK